MSVRLCECLCDCVNVYVVACGGVGVCLTVCMCVCVCMTERSAVRVAHDGSVTALHFLSGTHGRLLASCGADDAMRVWNMSSWMNMVGAWAWTWQWSNSAGVRHTHGLDRLALVMPVCLCPTER